MTGFGMTALAAPAVIALLVALFFVERSLLQRERRAAALATVAAQHRARQQHPAAHRPTTSLALVPATANRQRPSTNGGDDRWRSSAA